MAMKHYLTVRDEDFARAAQTPVSETAQKTAQSITEQPAQSREVQKTTGLESPENADLPVLAGTGDGMDNVPENHAAPRGFEQSPLAGSKNAISQTPRAPDSAPNAENPPSDPDLALIQDRWPKLPEHIKAPVLALVRAAEPGDGEAGSEHGEEGTG